MEEEKTLEELQKELEELEKSKSAFEKLLDRFTILHTILIVISIGTMGAIIGLLKDVSIVAAIIVGIILSIGLLFYVGWFVNQDTYRRSEISEIRMQIMIIKDKIYHSQNR